MKRPIVLVSLLIAGAAFAGWPDVSRAPATVGGGEKDAALIIGAETYVALPPVPGAVRNATDWYLYLANTLKVPPANLTLLKNNEATVEKLRKFAAQAAAQVKPGGTLWLVFIGHGAPAKDGSDGVVVGFDAQQDPDSLYARSLSQTEPLSILGKGAQARTVAIIDACFSGRSASGPLVPGLQPVIALRPLEATGSRVVLTAGGGDQFAGPLPGLGRPAFSYLVLGALRGWGDANQDGLVDAREATDFATLALQATVKDRTQTPGLVGAAGVLAKSSREPAPDLATIVAELVVAPSAPGPSATRVEPPVATTDRPAAARPAEAPASSLTTIAVAELKGRVPPELQWLGGSIADAVLVKLQKSRQVRVVEREFLDQLAAELKLQSSASVDQASAVRMGRVLGARVFVFGSVALVDGQVLVRARLVNVERGETIGEPIEVSGSPARLAALQTDVAKDVVKALSIELALADATGLESTELAFEAYGDLDRLRLSARGLPLWGADPARRRRMTEWQSALGLVTRLQAAYPRLGPAATFGSLFSLQADDLERAATQVELARKLSPNDVESTLLAVNVAQARGDAEQAWRLAVEATTRFPDDARGWYLLARLQVARREAPGAVVSLLGALERAPRVPEAEPTLRTLISGPDGSATIAALKEPRARAAAVSFRAFFNDAPGSAAAEAMEVTRSSPALHIGHLLLGMNERRAGNLARAEQALLTAIGLRPDVAEAHRELADLYVDLRRCSDAEAHASYFLRKAIVVKDSAGWARRVEGCRARGE